MRSCSMELPEFADSVARLSQGQIEGRDIMRLFKCFEYFVVSVRTNQDRSVEEPAILRRTVIISSSNSRQSTTLRGRPTEERRS
jgi:hypothetical protein